MCWTSSTLAATSRQWLTPNGPPGNRTAWRLLRLPQDNAYLGPVTGALLLLAEASNWEQFGDQTPEETADYFWEWLQEFAEQYTPPAGGTMIGAILPIATTDLPTGTLLCDGTQYTKASYPDLYAVLDTAYIDDASHFHTPDLRNRFVVGAGDDYDQGDEGGESAHTLTASEMPAHTHDIIQFKDATGGLSIQQSANSATNRTLTPPTSSAGGGVAHENRPPYHGVRFVIVSEA
jgi:microcystin-dependent protein